MHGFCGRSSIGRILDCGSSSYEFDSRRSPKKKDKKKFGSFVVFSYLYLMKKICSTCKENKNISEFHIRKTGKPYSNCILCQRQYVKNHYNKNKEYYIKKAKKFTNKSTDEVDKYKESLSCTDCNLSFKGHPYLCDFHHIDSTSKQKNPAELRTFSLKKFKEESDKCIPLCANCHRKRHFALLAKLDKASEYESEDFEGSSPSQSTLI